MAADRLLELGREAKKKKTHLVVDGKNDVAQVAETFVDVLQSTSSEGREEQTYYE